MRSTIVTLYLLSFIFLSCSKEEKKAPAPANPLELKKLCKDKDKPSCLRLCNKYGSLTGCEGACELGDKKSCGKAKQIAKARAPKAVPLEAKVGAVASKWELPKRFEGSTWHKRLFDVCRNGSIKACVSLAEYYPISKKSAQSDLAYFKQYASLCEKEGNPVACDRLGSILLMHPHASLNPKKAHTYFERACDKSKGLMGCLELGALYESGLTVNREHKKAKTVYEKGCKGRNYFSCVALAMLEARKEQEKWKIPAVDKALRRACRAGNKYICNRLKCRNKGSYKPMSLKKYKNDLLALFSLSERHCKEGSQWACAHAARDLTQGLKTKRDLPKAMKVAQKLCDADFGPGCYELARVRRAMGGKKPELKKVAKEYSKACRLKFSPACLEAGILAEEINDKDAMFSHLQWGCSLNNLMACGKLGNQLALGGFGGKNIARAKTLLVRACRGGEDEGCRLLQQIYFREELFDMQEKDKGFDQLRRLCALRVPGMCGYLSLVIAQGWGVKADPKGAQRLAKKMCSCGSGAGCYALGLLSYRYKFGCRTRRCRMRYYRRARGKARYFSRGCKLGHPGACAEYANYTALPYIKTKSSWHRHSRRQKKELANIRKAAEIGCKNGWENGCLVKQVIENSN